MKKIEFIHKLKELIAQYEQEIPSVKEESYSFDYLIDVILTKNPYKNRKIPVFKPRGLTAKILRRDLGISSKATFTTNEINDIVNIFLENIFKGK